MSRAAGPASRPRAGTAAWRLADALLFAAALYAGVDASGMAFAGALSPGWAVPAWALAAWATAWLPPRLGDRGDVRLARWFGPGLLAAAALLQALLLSIGPAGGLRLGFWGWVVNEWHQAPVLHGRMLAALWPSTLPVLAAALAALVLHAAGRPWPLRALLALALAAYGWTALRVPDAGRHGFILAPLVLALVLGLAGQDGPERRLALPGVGTFLIWASYFALIPFDPPTPAEAEAAFPGLRRAWPPPGQAPAIPLTHVRDVKVLPDGRMVCTWGATCGLMVFDPATGEQRVRETDMLRFIELDPERGLAIAGGWFRAAWLAFDLRDLRKVQDMDLAWHGLGQVFQVRLDRTAPELAGWAVSYEPPVVARVEAGRGRVADRLDLAAEGATDLPCGTAWLEPAPEGDVLYLVAGLTRFPWTFSLLELSARPLAVRRSLELPELPLKVVVAGDRLLVSSFYSDRVWEVDRRRLAVVEEHRAVPHARLFLHDRARDLVVAGSFFDGTLAVYDRAFHLLHAAPVAGRIQYGEFTPDGRVALTTTSGIFLLDLDVLLASLADRPADPAPGPTAPAAPPAPGGPPPAGGPPGR